MSYMFNTNSKRIPVTESLASKCEVEISVFTGMIFAQFGKKYIRLNLTLRVNIFDEVYNPILNRRRICGCLKLHTGLLLFNLQT